MGWSGGTRIFDAVAEELYDQSFILTSAQADILVVLGKALQEADWDNECESSFWEDNRFKKIWQRLGVEIES